jgi:hypothetical protein
VNDNVNWTNAQFHAALAARLPAYTNALASWQEQRDLPEVYGMAALGDHPLAAQIRARSAVLTPAVPSTNGLTPVPEGQWTQPLVVPLASGGNVTLALEAAGTGALTQLLLRGHAWADTAHPVGLFTYRTYNETSFNATPTCCYGQGNATAVAHPQELSVHPAVTAVWRGAATLLVQATMPPLAVSYYGAPSLVYINYTVVDDAAVTGGELRVELQLFNKTNTRLAEASFFGFSAAPTGDYAWLMDKLGGAVDPLEGEAARGQGAQKAVGGAVMHIVRSKFRFTLCC